jgi:hypothetical protein
MKYIFGNLTLLLVFFYGYVAAAVIFAAIVWLQSFGVRSTRFGARGPKPFQLLKALMSSGSFCLLFAAGLIGVAVNAAAGGGTFFTFSAFLSTGVGSVLANPSTP